MTTARRGGDVSSGGVLQVASKSRRSASPLGRWLQLVASMQCIHIPALVDSALARGIQYTCIRTPAVHGMAVEAERDASVLGSRRRCEQQADPLAFRERDRRVRGEVLGEELPWLDHPLLIEPARDGHCSAANKHAWPNVLGQPQIWPDLSISKRQQRPSDWHGGDTPSFSFFLPSLSQPHRMSSRVVQRVPTAVKSTIQTAEVRSDRFAGALLSNKPVFVKCMVVRFNSRHLEPQLRSDYDLHGHEHTHMRTLKCSMSITPCFMFLVK